MSKKMKKAPRAKPVLSKTDIHYIAGFLYVAAGESLISVTLGEKIYDARAEERRDVDIAAVTAGTIGVLAVEVKDHARSLDVTQVEQLCQKLLDMPDVTKRAIISSSGFTKPALRKARSHDVACLRLVRGAPRATEHGIQIKDLTELTVNNTRWSEGPRVVVGPSVPLTEREKAQVHHGTVVELHDGTRLTLKELADRIARQYDPGAVDLEGQTEVRVDQILALDHPVRLQIDNRVVQADDAQIVGVVRRTTETLPLHDSRYLADEEGEPFAEARLFELGGTLFGLTVGGDGQTLRAFQLPNDVRVNRPIGRRILNGSS